MCTCSSWRHQTWPRRIAPESWPSLRPDGLASSSGAVHVLAPEARAQVRIRHVARPRGRKRVPRPSCKAIKAAEPRSADGEYVIDSDGSDGAASPFTVHCNMSESGGGWTLAAGATRWRNGWITRTSSAGCA
ncbi:fibrinogen-like YCDxxxxGGGW domain-containing protein [Sorangium sp. So ce321]|uniref:fibrinogen-like YCDxxxxGGGW domain-containing protein n=1 Tax=Sorangium sp. So ce321 TaxID=3133300 RepID=UPI003F63CE52